MRQAIFRWVGISAAASVLACAISSAADPDPRHSFKVGIDAHIDMVIEGKKVPIEAKTTLQYGWATKDDERILSFDSVQVKATNDGALILDTFMNSEKLTNTRDEMTEEVPIETAPAALKTMLKDSFSTPICRILVDANRKELKRTIVAGPGAKDLIAQGMIGNALFFHPPFMKQGKWSAANEISMGNGGFAKGDLTYQTTVGGKNGQAVKVSGTLTNDGFSPPGTPLTIKNAKYVVSGNQTYDPDQKEWASGKLTIDMSFDMTMGDKEFATAKGTMKLNFEKLADAEE